MYEVWIGNDEFDTSQFVKNCENYTKAKEVVKDLQENCDNAWIKDNETGRIYKIALYN